MRRLLILLALALAPAASAQVVVKLRGSYTAVLWDRYNASTRFEVTK